MHKGFIQTAAALGAISVMLGAFAAHGLKEQLGAEYMPTFETGVRYQFYHVFALLATGIMYKYIPSSRLIWAGRLFIAGIILFSCSLYILSVAMSSGITEVKWIGAITPLGGICFIAGWVLILIAVNKREGTQQM